MIMQAMVKLGRGDDAVTSCTEALEIDGDLVEALVQRGEAKLLVEDWEGAVADLRSAAEKSPRILGYEDKRTRYDSGEDIDGMGMNKGGGGFNLFGGGGQQFTFHFQGGYPGGFGGF
ncbi:dnaJ protein P58IPK homolog A-like isoform X2 [Salvia miltiorrhiza]|uniref:dnaJ protein P58IPK homolog A-like isoform X2 n=1 Tax=Salvia miltiorrhiza TaxID=226208 RepID=UPI0025AB7B4C|nr:dnaJ protein P58IPK homolog A-like isoform X2 [Salvia miltiorrhiza]XP_057805454.1 dnaJ protein P58IPK homolog A-like isoform X2 [Salvia miltiorrhiza]